MYSAIALSLAAMAAAAPLAPSVPSTGGSSQSYGQGNGQSGRGQQNGVKYTANFDDLETGLLTGITVVDASPLAAYQGLEYEGFTVVAPLLGATLGIQPESDPNAIAYGGALDTLLDTLGLLDTAEGPLITSQYPGSAANTFDFKSFYFGCQNGLAGGIGLTTQSCVVTVTGYRNGEEVANQDFDYNAPTLGVTDDMRKARLNSDFLNIDTARFSTDPSGLAVEALVVTLLDNLEYTVYNAQNYNNQYGNKGGEQQYGSQGAAKNGTSQGW